MKIPAKDDVEDFNRSIRAMEVLAFKPVEQESIFRVLSAILHTGQCQFITANQNGLEAADVENRGELTVVAGLLVGVVYCLCVRECYACECVCCNEAISF